MELPASLRFWSAGVGFAGFAILFDPRQELGQTFRVVGLFLG